MQASLRSSTNHVEYFEYVDCSSETSRLAVRAGSSPAPATLSQQLHQQPHHHHHHHHHQVDHGPLVANCHQLEQLHSGLARPPTPTLASFLSESNQASFQAELRLTVGDPQQQHSYEDQRHQAGNQEHHEQHHEPFCSYAAAAPDGGAKSSCRNDANNNETRQLDHQLAQFNHMPAGDSSGNRVDLDACRRQYVGLASEPMALQHQLTELSGVSGLDQDVVQQQQQQYHASYYCSSSTVACEPVHYQAPPGQASHEFVEYFPAVPSFPTTPTGPTVSQPLGIAYQPAGSPPPTAYQSAPLVPADVNRPADYGALEMQQQQPAYQLMSYRRSQSGSPRLLMEQQQLSYSAGLSDLCSNQENTASDSGQRLKQLTEVGRGATFPLASDQFSYHSLELANVYEPRGEATGDARLLINQAPPGAQDNSTAAQGAIHSLDGGQLAGVLSEGVAVVQDENAVNQTDHYCSTATASSTYERLESSRRQLISHTEQHLHHPQHFEANQHHQHHHNQHHHLHYQQPDEGQLQQQQQPRLIDFHSQAATGHSLGASAPVSTSLASPGHSSSGDSFSDSEADSFASQLTRDEKRALEANIPLSYYEIVNLTIEQFNEQISKHCYTEQQLNLMKDIRRRGKNKVAAQTCRKRKMEQILLLQNEVDQLKLRRRSLYQEKVNLIEQHNKLIQDYDKIYAIIRERVQPAPAAKQSSLRCQIEQQ